MAHIERINDATCDSFGEGQDGRDYVSMAQAIDTSIRGNLLEADAQQREGYLRALTDLLSAVADGCVPDLDFDPVASTEASFRRARAGVVDDKAVRS